MNDFITPCSDDNVVTNYIQKFIIVKEYRDCAIKNPSGFISRWLRHYSPLLLKNHIGLFGGDIFVIFDFQIVIIVIKGEGNACGKGA